MTDEFYQLGHIHMKKIFAIAAAIVSVGLFPAFAQFGPHGGGQGPNFDTAMAKLFGDHQSFTAGVEFQTTMAGGNDITMPGKMSFDAGKSRFEMNMSEIQGAHIPATAAAQMKAMGMDTVVAISRPDLKLAYAVYPGLTSYAEMSSESSSPTNLDDYKMEKTELGKETLDGHDCTKNKVTVTDKDGNKHESTVWNATDLKNFPIKIVTNENGKSVTMQYKDISFNKPAASLFEAPLGYTKYDNVQTMMQSEMMKRMAGGAGAPPH